MPTQAALTAKTLTVARITAFLHHLETGRHNQPATRNVRLSAIHSFFRYLGRENPEYLRQAQCVLSIPFKRTSIREIEHLDFNEIRAVIASVDRTQSNGIRDRALLSLMINTGARSARSSVCKHPIYGWRLRQVLCCGAKAKKKELARSGRKHRVSFAS